LGIYGVRDKFTGEIIDVEERFQTFVPVRDCQQNFVALCDEVFASHTFKSHNSSVNFLNRKFQHQLRIEGKYEGVENTFMSFFDWVSLNWYHVVGTGNVAHFLAGCRVEQIRSWGGVLSYCAKYMSKADSENFMSDIATGRSWGVHNRVSMPWAKLIELPLDDEMGVRLRRVARHFLERRLGRRVQRHYGVTVYCDVAQWKRLLARPPDQPF
jgi:hypothetical protein